MNRSVSRTKSSVHIYLEWLQNMKQLTFVGPEKVEWREVADSRVEGALEAIVAPLVVGRCDLVSDS